MGEEAATTAPHITGRPSQRRNRTFTDDEQAEALALLDANGGHVARTARELGISDETLRCWARGTRRPLDPAVLASVKAGLSDAYVSLARKALRQASSKVDEMSGSAATIAAAVATDKFLLLNGEGPRGAGTVNVTVNTVNVAAAVLAPQDIAQARSLLCSVIALPPLSEGQEGAVLQSSSPLSNSPAERSAEIGPKAREEAEGLPGTSDNVPYVS